MEAITLIGNILLNYKILLKNSVPTDSIDLLICRWTKSNNVNMINKTSVQKQMLIDLKKKDKSCTTLSRFTEIYHGTYITNECLMLLQELIDRFIMIDSSFMAKFFMINADELTKALLSCNAILGGSIVAQSFHGDAETVFKTSDANFYVPVKSDSTALEDLILSSGYELYTTDLPLSLLHNHLATNYMDSYFYSADVSYKLSSNILLVSNYKNDFGVKIQIIKVQCPADVKTTFDFGQFVVNDYDLTFLQNFFDGSNLYTNDFNGVVKKTGSVTALVRTACTVDVSTAKNPELLTTWYRSITATIIRCLKYQQRGFLIDGVPEFSLVTELGIL